jgi:hypothetical protein
MAIETAQQYLARDLWNTPVGWVRRTPREVLCFALGIWILSREVAQPSSGNLFYVNVSQPVIFTCAFALRFFLARILATTAAFAAGAQWWIGRQEAWSAPLEQNWRAYACLAVLAILASPDLVRRFERGRVPRWWSNPWASLDRLDLVLVRWSLYPLYMVAALIHKGYAQHHGSIFGAGETCVDWVPTYTAALGLVGIGLALGRRHALVALPGLYLWTLYHIFPRPAPAGRAHLAPPLVWEHMAHATQPAILIAVVGLGLSAWLAVRHLRAQLEW